MVRNNHQLNNPPPDGGATSPTKKDNMITATRRTKDPTSCHHCGASNILGFEVYDQFARIKTVVCAPCWTLEDIQSAAPDAPPTSARQKNVPSLAPVEALIAQLTTTNLTN